MTAADGVRAAGRHAAGALRSGVGRLLGHARPAPDHVEATRMVTGG
jgi:hypothetical protein